MKLLSSIHSEGPEFGPILTATKAKRPQQKPGRPPKRTHLERHANPASPTHGGGLDGGDPIFRIYLREIGQGKLLSREEEAELAKRIQAGDADARERMIKGNLRLVVKIASEFDGYGVPLLDLISEGNIGLMKAADRFDPSHGAKFSTYAAWWIKQGIRRALANQGRTVRMPVHAQEKLVRISRVAITLQEELGREPTDAELASEVGLPEKKVRRLRAASQRPVSLDEPTFNDAARTVAETVADENARPADHRQGLEEAIGLLHEAFEDLDPREQQVLRSRFGLGGEEAQTLESIGAEIGITREYVRQIQNRALGKMRRKIGTRE